MTTENIYYWSSTGGCARCDAMEGHHIGEEPTRPHILCQCDITLEHEAGNDCYMLYTDGEWWSDWSLNPSDGNDIRPGESFEIVHRFELHCLMTNERHQFDIRVEVNTSDWYTFDPNGRADGFPDEIPDTSDEAQTKAEAKAEELCLCNGGNFS